MANDWERIVNSTITQHVRGAIDNTMRVRKWLAMLQARGRITFNNRGKDFDWRIKFKEAPVTTLSSNPQLGFAPTNYYKVATLDYRGYNATDQIGKFEKLKNRGEEAIVDVVGGIVENLTSSMQNRLGGELYVDGNASGNEERFHGVKSFLSVSGAATNGYVGTTNDTYAGLSTAPGNYDSSTWSTSGGNTIWPRGNGDAAYDFFMPLVLLYDNASWAAATDTWANNCKEVLRFAILHGGRNKMGEGRLDMVMLDRELYRQFLGALDAEERLNVQPGGSAPLYKLGFAGEFINFDGTDITWEFDTPVNEGFGLSLDNMGLRAMFGQLIEADPVDYDPRTQADLFSVNCFGNLWFNPRAFCHLRST